MTVPYSFGSATSAIPLSQLDSNFNTPITLGNTAIQLGNTVTTLNNMTLANVTISSGSVTLTSVSVTNANVTSTLTLSGLTASTALALDASKNVVSVTNTGTGNNVLGTSPTMSGVTLSDGTANGVAYLNGSKVVTTGSALTFDGSYLNVFNTNTGFRVVNGATYISGVTTNNATGEVQYFAKGAYFPTFYANGSEQMRLDSSGNLGIGTSSPATKLDVTGAVHSTAGLVIGASIDGTTGGFSRSGGDTYLDYAGSLRFRSGAASERMLLDTSGNLGIGTSSPTYKLNVLAGAGSQSIFQAGQSGVSNGYTIVSNGTNLTHQWYNGGSEAMRLDSSGNLGIGTTSPGSYSSKTLQVTGSSTDVAIKLTNTTTGSGSGAGFDFELNGNDINYVNRTATGVQKFWTNATERARIDSSGNLGIGTTSPNAAAIIDAQSTTKGVRFPNMTTTQKNAISSPPAGLVVFDTTLSKLCVYSGSAWQTITSV